MIIIFWSSSSLSGWWWWWCKQISIGWASDRNQSGRTNKRIIPSNQKRRGKKRKSVLNHRWPLFLSQIRVSSYNGKGVQNTHSIQPSSTIRYNFVSHFAPTDRNKKVGVNFRFTANRTFDQIAFLFHFVFSRFVDDCWEMSKKNSHKEKSVSNRIFYPNRTILVKFIVTISDLNKLVNETGFSNWKLKKKRE